MRATIVKIILLLLINIDSSAPDNTKYMDIDEMLKLTTVKGEPLLSSQSVPQCSQ